jgi:hypothetical protein
MNTRREFLKTVGVAAAVGTVPLCFEDVKAKPVPVVPSTSRFYVSLHHNQPGDNQACNEVRFSGYRRVPIEFALDGTSSLVEFPQCSGGKDVVRWFAIGTRESGRGPALVEGAVDASCEIYEGITISFARGAIRLD